MANDLLLLDGTLGAIPSFGGESKPEETKRILALIKKSGLTGEYIERGETLKLSETSTIKASVSMYVEVDATKNQTFGYVTILDTNDLEYTVGDKIKWLSNKSKTGLSRRELKASPELSILDNEFTSIMARYVGFLTSSHGKDIIIRTVNVIDTNDRLSAITKAMELNHASKASIRLSNLTAFKKSAASKLIYKNVDNGTELDNMNLPFTLSGRRVAESGDTPDDGVLFFEADAGNVGEDTFKCRYSISIVGTREKQKDGEVKNLLIPVIRIVGTNIRLDTKSGSYLDNSASSVAAAAAGILRMYKSNTSRLIDDLTSSLTDVGDVKASIKKLGQYGKVQKTLKEAVRNAVTTTDIIVSYTAKIGGMNSINDATGVNSHLAKSQELLVNSPILRNNFSKLLDCTINGVIPKGDKNYVSNILIQPLYKGIDIVFGSPELIKLDNWSDKDTLLGQRLNALFGANCSEMAEKLVEGYMGTSSNTNKVKSGYAVTYVFTNAFVVDVMDNISASIDGEGELISSNAFNIESTTTTDDDGLSLRF